MLTKKVEDLSVVRLKDGREGTVVEVFDCPDKPLGYMVDLSADEYDVVTVTHEQVAAVIWTPTPEPASSQGPLGEGA